MHSSIVARPGQNDSEFPDSRTGADAFAGYTVLPMDVKDLKLNSYIMKHTLFKLVLLIPFIAFHDPAFYQRKAFLRH